MCNLIQEYKLSVCIPNYGREEQFRRLLDICLGQIVDNHLESKAEICISDDCSPTDPERLVETAKRKFPTVCIRYTRNEQNRGMDYNFLNSVLIAHGQYAWIVGNDDVPENDAVFKIMSVIETKEYEDTDIIVTPFDSFDYDGKFVETVYPLGKGIRKDILFDTSDKGQLHELIMGVKDNSAVFGFLSNVVFKRKRWIEHGDMFADRMSSIFIQVYMNLQTLMEGAKYLYSPQKIIKNYLDDETNHTVDRTYRIAVGLYDAMDYFFRGEEREYIQRNVLDIFMSSTFLEFPENDARKIRADSFISERMDILKQYYVRSERREQYFHNKKVIVYGAGNFGHIAIDDLMRHGVEIIGICDADVQKQGKSIQGKLIFNFDSLLEEYGKCEGCIVVVANNRHLVQIIKSLLDNSVLRIAVIT